MPILALGTAPMGKNLRGDEATRLVETAVDAGITYIDTAPAVGGYGDAQLHIGRALEGRRDEVFLTTKCFEPDGDDARRLLERSLEELRTDRVDLVFTHSLGNDKMDPEVALGAGGVMRALERARDEGLARFVGVSSHNRPGRLQRALEEFDVDVVMTAVNFADVHTYDFEGRVWGLARERGIGLVAMKVFAGPARAGFTPALLPEEDLEPALRYALSLGGCASASVGFVDEGELRECVEWARRFRPLTSEERRALLERGRALAREWGPHLGPVEE